MQRTIFLITRTGLDRPLVMDDLDEAEREYNYWASKGFTVTLETGTISLVSTNQDLSDLAIQRLREKLRA